MHAPFQSLFADYSDLDLTYKTDRPVAIDSLAWALAKAFNTNVRYGIFQHLPQRSLLWQRSQDIPLERISFAAGQALPSWSWMAYHGQIEYPDTRYSVYWDTSVQFVEDKESNASNNPENDGYVLKARVRRLRDCEIKPEGLRHVIRDEKDEVGHLCFDSQPGKALTEVWCAIMGKEARGKDGKWQYYVLLVTECAMHPGCGKFKGVGMGWIQQRFILFDYEDDTAQTL